MRRQPSSKLRQAAAALLLFAVSGSAAVLVGATKPSSPIEIHGTQKGLGSARVIALGNGRQDNVAANTSAVGPSTLGPSIVFVRGTQLVVQKRMTNGVLAPAVPYTIRGVNWSPASRGTNTTPTDRNNANVRRPEFGIWYRTDIPLMKAMNVNTVRLFIDPGFDSALGPVGLEVLDELYRNDIMVIITVDDAINDLARIQSVVPFYKNHPAILMWSLGSEWNISRYFRGWSVEMSAQQTEIAARLVKSLDTLHPVASSYGEIDIDAAGLRLADTSRYVNTVVPTPDLWSINLFRGNSFDNRDNVSAFAQWASISSKPVFLGEFGIDAFHGRCLSNPPTGSLNEAEQVTWNLDLWNDVARNLSARDPARLALGGTVFEWNDEWWKVPPPGSQQTGGWTSDGFPDWHGTEEYFGLVDIDRTPRQGYAALTAAFDPEYVPPPHAITFRAISRGANMCGAQANFRRDGNTFYQRFGFGSGGRGFNVATVDPASGEILDRGKNFDTWGGGDAAKQALIDHLNAIPNGRLIMIAVADEAGITFANTQQCTPRNDAATLSLVQLLRTLGSTRIDEYCWRGSWAMVAIKGTGVALAEDYQRFEEARAEPALVIPEAPTPPVVRMTLDRHTLHFGAVTNALTFVSHTSSQIVRLTQSGAGTVTWTATSNQPWLTVSPASGAGPAELVVAVRPTGGLPFSGSIAATITLSLTGAPGIAGPLTVFLALTPAGTSAPPFGVVDTPLDHSTGVSGAVPFTGWALDDIDVDALTICRGAVTGESPPMDGRCGGAAQVFVGDVVFIDGARPDVAAAFPSHPRSTRAGWGFMVLTNMLPDVARGLPTGGNGTFTLYVYADDREGNVALLGTRTMTCDNEHATKPFGTIDTPGQGEVVSGSSYVNFGWALTPNPKFIPMDGSTITVFVNGVAIGSPSYNHFRPDIAGFFPGLANSNGAVGFRVLDTTAMPNGVHTIAWGVTDNLGAAEGLGSRYFTVSNGVAATPALLALGAFGREIEDDGAGVAGPGVGKTVRAMAEASAEAPGAPAPARRALGEGGRYRDLTSLPVDRSPILGRRGWDLGAPWREYFVGASGRAIVRGEELDRFELQLSATDAHEYAGYLRVGHEPAPLPVGSHLDATSGRFTWAPGVGFVGTYALVFVRSDAAGAVARREVRIVLAPKGSGRLGPQVVIDTPAPDVGGISRIEIDQPFMLAGWAADLAAEAGTGIDTLHVWAYPLTGASAIFLGVADSGGARPDVAAVHGEHFRDSGYGLIVQGLAPGDYDLAVFAWSTVSQSFVPARVVRVAVR